MRRLCDVRLSQMTCYYNCTKTGFLVQCDRLLEVEGDEQEWHLQQQNLTSHLFFSTRVATSITSAPKLPPGAEQKIHITTTTLARHSSPYSPHSYSIEKSNWRSVALGKRTQTNVRKPLVVVRQAVQSSTHHQRTFPGALIACACCGGQRCRGSKGFPFFSQ